jgi:hypothetical protein
MTKNKSLVKDGLRKIYLNIIKNKKQLSVLGFLLLLCLAQIAVNSAQAGTLWDAQVGKTEVGTPFGASGGQAGDLKGTIINIIQTLLGFFGLVMTIIIIWSGWRWMTAGGDEKKVETARSHLIQAAIGGIIIIAAYVITYIVVQTSYQMITNSIWPL